MRVQKRNGKTEEVSFDKILNRIRLLSQSNEFSKKLDIDPTIIAQKVCSELYDGVTTTELDILSSEIAISMYSGHLDYATLASRIIVSNHHKKTPSIFSEVIEKLYENNIIHKYLFDLVEVNKDSINKKIDYTRDYYLDFFGFKTLEKSYLLKCDGIIIERPQHVYMRVALCIHRNNIEKAFETYDYISNQYFIHATPTLFNAGTCREQLASCFLLSMKDDSIVGIYDTLKDCAKISKFAGGIGLHLHNIRANGSYIAGTNGTSNGLVPMIRVFNDTARYVDQGGGKRNGSFAMYLEPWHADVFEFIELKKNHGNELERARDLFYALWIPDLFMKRVKTDSEWTLMCPHKCPGLSDCHGEEFNTLYTNYEKTGKGNRVVRARDLWNAILTTQIETGTPYLLYKDQCNGKSNQKNLGTIKSSNLCTEIIEYSDKDETAVCNLASISLPSCLDYKTFTNKFTIYSKDNCPYCDYTKKIISKMNVDYEVILLNDKQDRIKLYQTIDDKEEVLVETMPQIYYNNAYVGGFDEFDKFIKPRYNYTKLGEITKVLTQNLNNIIDFNFYPTPETERSNLRHRPIGIGVQGLANVFYEMGISFDSQEAKIVNKNIFECIYYHALEKSMEIAKVEGPYSTFQGSPASKGILQFDMWHNDNSPIKHNMNYDWDNLKILIKENGLRNSLLLAPMPTASTSQILGNYECFEPVMSNIYTRRVLAGEYLVLNNYLVQELMDLEIWNKELKDELIRFDGSVQNIDVIPDYIKKRYKTAWEIKQKNIIDMSADRGEYICQSQSLNLFIESPSLKVLTSMHFYAWQKGLKTGIYYLRSRPSSKAIQFTLKPKTNPEQKTDDGVCESCSG
jgi:ribonucleoside-diphosphate reductase subunit M1